MASPYLSLEPLTDQQGEQLVQWFGLVYWAFRRWPTLVHEIGQDVAYDVLMDGLIKAIQNHDPVHGATFRTYALTVLWSKLVRRAEQVRQQVRLRLAFILETDRGEERYGRQAEQSLAEDEVQILWEAVARLPDHLPAVILRRYRDGYTYREISDELGISREHVRHLEHRALYHLRQLLM